MDLCTASFHTGLLLRGSNHPGGHQLAEAWPPISNGGQNSLEYLALLAHLHLLPPAFLHFALADLAIDEPTKLSILKRPCWAISSGFCGTDQYYPAGRAFSVYQVLLGQKK